jgi:uncharacterized protein (TIGR04255 family)
MKRTLPSQRLARSPLVHVLAQVRYSPVFKIGDSIISIQERLKEVGFPRFEKSQLQSVVISDGQDVHLDRMDRWDFLDKAKMRGVVLTRDFVVLHTNKYSVFDEFRSTLQAILDVLASTIELNVVERTGLRYVDLVRAAPGESLAEYVEPGLMGFPFSQMKEIGNTSLGVSRTESVAKTDSGLLTVRSLQTNSGQFLPPDLLPTVLEYDLAIPHGEWVVILDFDHFTTEPSDFSAAAVIETMDGLHDPLDVAFRRAVTQQAMTRCGQQLV